MDFSRGTFKVADGLMCREEEESMHFKASCQFGFVLVFTA